MLSGKWSSVSLFTIFALQGCIVYTDGGGAPSSTPAAVNEAPGVGSAEAGCYWDSYYYDDIWYFEAFTADPNGAYDVAEVWADVYDEFYGPTYIESFELYPTNDPNVWYSDWLGSSTWLDPWYDGYTVDFVAYDWQGLAGATTVWAYTY